MHFNVDAPDDTNKLMAPISLQLLLENAVKHNEFDEKKPLTINLRLSNGWVEVTNNLRAKALKNTSKIGLRNLTERYRLLTGKEVVVEQTEHEFKVKLPYLVV